MADFFIQLGYFLIVVFCVIFGLTVLSGTILAPGIIVKIICFFCGSSITLFSLAGTLKMLKYLEEEWEYLRNKRNKNGI